jgi:hypothetical protein
MKYLSNAVNFTIKNWMLIIPVFAVMALATIIQGTGSAISLATIASLADLDNLASFESLIKLVPTVLALTVAGGVVSFIGMFIYEPATFGLVNKGLETGNAALTDLGTALSANFVKYVLNLVGRFVVGLVLSIASLIIALIMGLLISLLKGFGIFLTVIVLLALVVFFIAFGALTSLWFPAMVVDGLDVVGAFKKSIEIVRTCFWTVFGITLLVGVIASIASTILSFLGYIPVLGAIILSAIPSIQYFVMTTFSLMIYREKTGRAA